MNIGLHLNRNYNTTPEPMTTILHLLVCSNKLSLSVRCAFLKHFTLQAS